MQLNYDVENIDENSVKSQCHGQQNLDGSSISKIIPSHLGMPSTRFSSKSQAFFLEVGEVSESFTFIELS